MTTDIAPTDLELLDPAVLAQRDGEKWASAGQDIIPAWVADMDFPVAPAVAEAVVRRARGDLGYPVWFDESDGGPLGEGTPLPARRSWT
ncbi:hypothetical protein [Kitasatospora sp. P5_F3]